MMLKFNNAHSSHRGEVVWINSEHITAVYETSAISGGSLSTKIFGGFTGTEWTVEESLNEVFKKLRNANVDIE